MQNKNGPKFFISTLEKTKLCFGKYTRSLCVRGKSPLDVVAVIFCKESRSRGFGQQAFGSKPHSLLYSLLHIVCIPGYNIEW